MSRRRLDSTDLVTIRYMKSGAHTRIDPIIAERINNIQQSPIRTKAIADMKTQRCIDCRALLPIESFGTSKYNKSGYSVKCKECRAQYFRLRRKNKFNATPRPHIDDSILRSVKAHNKVIIDTMLSSGDMELRGFDCLTKAEYKIYYGFYGKLDCPSFTMFTRNGASYFEWIMVDKNKSKFIEGYLKLHNIRLELSDEDVIASKTVIYYL